MGFKEGDHFENRMTKSWLIKKDIRYVQIFFL